MTPSTPRRARLAILILTLLVIVPFDGQVSPFDGQVSLAAAEPDVVSGVVVDASGAPVPGARVQVVDRGSLVAETETGDDGRFSLAIGSATDPIVTASAPGFALASLATGADDRTGIRLALFPEALTERVTVTASRGRDRLDTPGAATVVTSAELLNSGAGTVDDVLRSTPGFSLFRRSSSRVANPTTQGVTLRGVSGSGASRTLVLANGEPLNDPFGSWVYWNRIPQAAIDRVEVVRGATGDLYGADALGGVIQILTFSPRQGRVRGTFEGGQHGTTRGSAFAGGQRRGWNATVAGEAQRTDGVIIVAPTERGTADIEADSDYSTGFLTAGYDAGQWRLQGRASAYAEDRNNGTPLQVNTTDWREYAGDSSGSVGTGVWQARVSGGSQTYYQTFSAVADDRNSERIVRAQATPSSFWGASGQWVQPVGSHTLLVGAESHRTESTLRETGFSFVGAIPLPPVFFGGTEETVSGFGRVRLATRDDVTIVLGARGDYWQSTPNDGALPTHSAGFFSPRGSIAWQLQGGVSVQASAYRAHRKPTLNELHRGFRVGNVLTNPNPLLEPEALTGFEGGVLVTGARTSARVTGFWNTLTDSIANITIRSTPNLITRERQNAGKVRAAGVEFEADFRPHPFVTVSGLAVFTSSQFLGTATLPELEGNRVPQVPKYQFGAGVTYANPAVLTASAQLRVLGAQWDDDLNTFELGNYGILDAYASRTLSRGLNVFVALENLFDSEFAVGTNPTTIGWPRTVRGGVRIFLP